jgi:hypothetical protein
MAVRPDDRDAVPRLQSTSAKRSGQRPAPFPELGVGEVLVATRDGGAMRTDLYGSS